MATQLQCPYCQSPLNAEHFDGVDQPVCPRCKDQLIKMAKRFRWVLWTAFLALPLVFGWLKFQGLDFAGAASRLEVDLLLKVSIAVYFLSWSLGCGWETSDIESLYAVAPN